MRLRQQATKYKVSKIFLFLFLFSLLVARNFFGFSASIAPPPQKETAGPTAIAARA